MPVGKLDFLSAFYSEKHKAGNIVAALDALLSTENADVRAIPFGCEDCSIDWLDGRIVSDKRVRLISRTEGLTDFHLEYTYKESGERKSGRGRFFVLKDHRYPNAFVALTIESSDFFQRALHPLIKGLYPKLITTFITHKKMRRLLEVFSNELGNREMVITRASQRLRYEEKDEKRHIVPMVSWPSLSLSEAFDWIYQQNGWFRSVTFEVREWHHTLASISFSRHGTVRADAMFCTAFNAFLIPVCKTIQENFEMFAHRARLERADLSATPLVIDFEANQFREIKENRRFIQAMRNLKTSSVSVLHGNPYVHLSVLDYFDGSAFDLWVLDASQIVIVPQLKASVAAIKRLINHIFDDYAEGRLANYSEGMHEPRTGT